MIVPTLRLLVCYAVLIPPLALLALVGQKGSALCLAAGSALILVAIIDGACARLGSRGIEVRLPPLTRMIRDREGTLGLGVERRRIAGGEIRVGLPFPAEIASPFDVLAVPLRAGETSAYLSWPCTPLDRGRFSIDACYVETSSFLGLWDFRRRQRTTCEVRVYPSLELERKALAGLFLNRGTLGLHVRRQQGKGRDFERLREYAAGDGYDEIHWKATAKRRRPITKVFQIERTQEVYVAIDFSRLGARRLEAFGSSGHAGGGAPSIAYGRTHLEWFIAAALVLGLAARQQGDLFGIAAFSDGVESFMRARAGLLHYNACRERIFSLRPRMVNPDYEELFTFIRHRIKRRSLIMILTDLDDPMLAETFARGVDLVCRQHLVIVTTLRPQWARPVFSDPGLASVDDIYDGLSGHALWHDLERLKRSLSGRGVEYALVDHEHLCIDLVSRYVSIKQRQVL